MIIFEVLLGILGATTLLALYFNLDKRLEQAEQESADMRAQIDDLIKGMDE